MEAIFGSIEAFVTGFINYLTFGIDIIAGIIIGVAVVIAFILFVKNIRKTTNERTIGLVLFFKITKICTKVQIYKYN